MYLIFDHGLGWPESELLVPDIFHSGLGCRFPFPPLANFFFLVPGWKRSLDGPCQSMKKRGSTRPS